jgi:RNA polymerase sigma factor (sigma-70 family)
MPVAPFPILWANRRSDVEFMVRSIAAGRGVTEDRFQTLVAAGQIALWEASNRYNTDKSRRGGSFWSFARHRIRGAIFDEMQTWDHISKSARTREQHGEFAKMPWALLHPCGLTEAAEIANEASPEEHAINAERSRQVLAMIASLPPQEKTVATKLFVEGKNPTEIARDLKLSLGRICQVRKEIRRKFLAASKTLTETG